jgi:hypothetical protein
VCTLGTGRVRQLGELREESSHGDHERFWRSAILEAR